MKVVLITAFNNDFDRNLAATFAQEGYKVYVMGNVQQDGITVIPADIKQAAEAVQKDSGFIDIYIDVSNESSLSDNFNVRTGINEQVIRDLYELNVTRPMAMLETFLPLLETGSILGERKTKNSTTNHMKKKKRFFKVSRRGTEAQRTQSCYSKYHRYNFKILI